MQKLAMHNLFPYRPYTVFHKSLTGNYKSQKPEEVTIAQQDVDPLMQGYAVRDATLAHHGIEPVASVGAGRVECSRRFCFFRSNIPLDRRCPHHNSSPSSSDTLRTLGGTADGLGPLIARRADGLRRRPQLGAPRPLLRLNETVEAPPGRDGLEQLDDIGHGDTRRNAHKKVNVIRLDLPGDHRLPSFGVDRIHYRSRLVSHRSGQHVTPILRTPDPLVGHWIEMPFRLPIISIINHTLHPIGHSNRPPFLPPWKSRLFSCGRSMKKAPSLICRLGSTCYRLTVQKGNQLSGMTRSNESSP